MKPTAEKMKKVAEMLKKKQMDVAVPDTRQVTKRKGWTKEGWEESPYQEKANPRMAR